MNDFVKAADAPNFDTAGILRRTRRKRATAIAGLATALLLAGGGTALATAVNGSDAPKPTVATTTATDDATILYDNHDVLIPIQLGGVNLDTAKAQFLKAQLKLGTVTKAACDGKPGAVIKADPHSPKTVNKGDTVNLTLCAGTDPQGPAPANADTTILYDSHDVLIPIQLGGMNLDMAKEPLLKAQLKLGTVTKAACDGKPGAVIKADPHSPKTVNKGDTVNLTLCAG